MVNGTKKRSDTLPIYKQPNHEPEKSLMTFGKSVKDPQKYHKKKRCMHTVEEVQ